MGALNLQGSKTADHMTNDFLFPIQWIPPSGREITIVVANAFLANIAELGPYEYYATMFPRDDMYQTVYRHNYLLYNIILLYFRLITLRKHL